LYIYIYVHGRLGANLDEVEDDLEELFANYGGEVTGTGSGQMGCNFDLEVSSPVSTDRILELLRHCFRRYPIQGSVKADIDGHTLLEL
jgi:hypothetical protein